MRIFAIVVTYNRLKCLQRVVDSLKKQTYPIARIVIVNNSSTDGTEKWLETLDANLFVIIKQDNLGGAGGFYRGCKYAYDNEAEWVWMMDDDVYPKVDCLEKLVSWTNISECIQAMRYTSDNVYVKSESFFYPIFNHVFSPTCYKSFENGKKFVPVNVGCFEGMFISKRIISEIGFPDSRYFIGGDDVVYGYLASYYTNPILVADAVMMRERKSNVFPKLSPMYLYYSIRNNHLIEDVIRKHYPSHFSVIIRKIIYLYRTVAVFINVIVFYPNKVKYLLSIVRGYRDYLLKKTGKTY